MQQTKSDIQIKNEILKLGGVMVPQVPDVEEAVLCSMLTDRSCLPIVGEIIHEGCFYKEENRKVYKAIMSIVEEDGKIDLMTVAEKLKLTNDYQWVGGAKFLAKLTNSISSSAHVEAHCRIILEHYIKRELISTSSVIMRDAYNESSDVFQLIEDTEKMFASTLTQIFKSTDESFADIAKREAYLVSQAKSNTLAGVSTGLKDLDDRISGLCQPDLLIIAARPGAGKSSLAFTMISNLALQGIPVGLITLEMSKGQVFNRINSINSEIHAHKIRNRSMNEYDLQQYYSWASKMEKWPIHINETANTINKLKIKATIWKNKFKIKALFFDYLQLMSGDGKKGQNREGEISDISRGLKQLAKTLEIPVIALSQLSREVEKRSTKMPQLSDLRESGSLEQDADFVLFLMRPEYYKMNGTFNIDGNELNSENLCIADLAKSRHSATGEFPLKFIGPTMKFTNYYESSQVIPIQEDGIKTKDSRSLINEFENNPF